MDYYESVVIRAIHFIEANLKEDIRLDDMAREASYSRFHFARMFTELTGEAPGSYLRRRRLEEAASEILAGGIILDIALDYHFGSQEAFTRSFKTHFLTTPGTYKKTGAYVGSGSPDRHEEAEMSKRLENLRWKSHWTTHLGCVKGCLDYLGIEVSDAWLFGGTGHAFVINVMDIDVCPSGPTAWDTQMVRTLGSNIGYETDGLFAAKPGAGDFAGKQEEAWEFVRKSIDQGMPCYGWELEIPEFYVVFGYDDIGYHYSGPLCDRGKGPKPWQDLGDTEIGIVEMDRVRPGRPADDAVTVRQALEFALEHARTPQKWTFPRYKAGLAGYDNWIRTLGDGTADRHGMAYNAAVWSECRGLGAQFLREARRRLDGEVSALLEDAAEQYDTVFQDLQEVANLFPFPPSPEGAETDDEERRNKAVAHLRKARDNEEAGLGLLETIVAAL